MDGTDHHKPTTGGIYSTTWVSLSAPFSKYLTTNSQATQDTHAQNNISIQDSCVTEIIYDVPYEHAVHCSYVPKLLVSGYNVLESEYG